MSEIDERLQQAMDDLAGVQLVDNTWQEAEAVRREIIGIIQALHRDLCAEASSACQEWDAKCQRLEAEAAGLRERLATAEDETTRLCKELTIASSLVPSAEWLLMIAAVVDGFGCDACPYLGNCENYCDRISDKARARAARIRAWRGDGDGDGGEGEGESDGD